MALFFLWSRGTVLSRTFDVNIKRQINLGSMLAYLLLVVVLALDRLLFIELGYFTPISFRVLGDFKTLCENLF